MAGKRRDPTFVFLGGIVAVVVVALVAVIVLGGGGGGDDSASPPTTAAASTTSTEPPDPVVTCPGAEGRTAELRRCLEPLLAFIETELGRGSGVLLDTGRILTNAHVVDPFGYADVTFPGGERFEHVRVLGIDADADIAVLDAVDTDRAGFHLGSLDDIDIDAEPEVFLAGYPGGAEGDDPHIALAGGLVSRLREAEAFGLTYVQTDAAVAGGQSGGALVDGEGRLLGISGLKFAQAFALALSVDDVAGSALAIATEGGDDRNYVPDIADADSFPINVEVPFYGGSAVVLVPAAPTDRTVEVSLSSPGSPVIFDASTMLGEPLGTNFDFAIEDLYDESVLYDLGYGQTVDEVAPGTWAVEVPADATMRLVARRADGQIGRITVDTSEPYVAFPDTPPLGGIGVGQTVDLIADGFTAGAVYTILLDEGQAIEVTARSVADDASFRIVDPTAEYDPFDAPLGQDGGGGMFDLDAQATFTAPQEGRYFIVVGALGSFSRSVAGFRLTVEAAG